MARGRSSAQGWQSTVTRGQFFPVPRAPDPAKKKYLDKPTSCHSPVDIAFFFRHDTANMRFTKRRNDPHISRGSESGGRLPTQKWQSRCLSPSGTSTKGRSLLAVEFSQDQLPNITAHVEQLCAVKQDRSLWTPKRGKNQSPLVPSLIGRMRLGHLL